MSIKTSANTVMIKEKSICIIQHFKAMFMVYVMSVQLDINKKEKKMTTKEETPRKERFLVYDEFNNDCEVVDCYRKDLSNELKRIYKECYLDNISDFCGRFFVYQLGNPIPYNYEFKVNIEN